jgi:hypothetical protein
MSEDQKNMIGRLKIEMNWMSVELKITLRETGENGDLI